MQKESLKKSRGFAVSPAVREKYLNRCKQELEACLKAIESQDFKFIERVGHQMHGSAATFGFNELSTLGEELENQAEMQNLSQINSALNELKSRVDVLTRIN